MTLTKKEQLNMPGVKLGCTGIGLIALGLVIMNPPLILVFAGCLCLLKATKAYGENLSQEL